jgi:excisionase family DNA binding protein
MQSEQSPASAGGTEGNLATLPSLPRAYLHKDELATVLGVSKRTITNWMKSRAIPFIKVGRTILFRPADVDRALQRFTFRAVGEERTS